MEFLNVNNIVFSLLGYNMSLVELLGTITGIICVWLTAKGKIMCWPVGILNALFFFILFYQVNLYSDMFLQVIFILTSAYGWYSWMFPSINQANNNFELKVTTLTNLERICTLIILGLFTYTLYTTISNIHINYPQYFPEPAKAPLRDAFCAVASVIAQIIMCRKKLECWLLWILVDVISCVYYFEVGVALVGIEYIMFTFIATKGLFGWRKELNSYE